MLAIVMDVAFAFDDLEMTRVTELPSEALALWKEYIDRHSPESREDLRMARLTAVTAKDGRSGMDFMLKPPRQTMLTEDDYLRTRQPKKGRK